LFQNAQLDLDWEVFDLCISEWTRKGGCKLVAITVQFSPVCQIYSIGFDYYLLF
jgi:hypothetical protein